LWTGIDWLVARLRGEKSRGVEPPSSTPRCIKNFADGSRIEFDAGKFDGWCVYVTRAGRERHAPRDSDYFAELKQLHGRFPGAHDDFVEIFSRTTKELDATVLARITELGMQYPAELRVDVDVLLTTFYAAMLAEENREHAPLGKRIKRLGVHQVLIEGMPIEEAVNFSRGQPWRELEKHCIERGF
jgi:hypothetical protein